MRIVSLCPSITETLIAVGRAEQLVGITRFCIHPAETVAELPKVGGTKDPDIAKIVAAAPDLVFVNEEENRKEDFDALVAAGIEVDSSMTERVDQVPDQLRHFGRRVDALTEAEGFARRLEDELELLAAAKAARAAPFDYVYFIWRKPWMVVGPGTYVDDLLSLAGGENAFGAVTARYPEITFEALFAHDPAVVLLPDEPFPFSDKHLPELQDVLPQARIELISGDDACWHGVRSIRGAALARRLAQTL